MDAMPSERSHEKKAITTEDAITKQLHIFVKTFQLVTVFRSILKTDDRRNTDGESKVERVKQKLSIQNNCDGSNSVFSCNAH